MSSSIAKCGTIFECYSANAKIYMNMTDDNEYADLATRVESLSSTHDVFLDSTSQGSLIEMIVRVWRNGNLAIFKVSTMFRPRAKVLSFAYRIELRGSPAASRYAGMKRLFIYYFCRKEIHRDVDYRQSRSLSVRHGRERTRTPEKDKD